MMAHSINSDEIDYFFRLWFEIGGNVLMDIKTISIWRCCCKKNAQECAHFSKYSELYNFLCMPFAKDKPSQYDQTTYCMKRYTEHIEHDVSIYLNKSLSWFTNNPAIMYVALCKIIREAWIFDIKHEFHSFEDSAAYSNINKKIKYDGPVIHNNVIIPEKLIFDIYSTIFSLRYCAKDNISNDLDHRRDCWLYSSTRITQWQKQLEQTKQKATSTGWDVIQMKNRESILISWIREEIHTRSQTFSRLSRSTRRAIFVKKCENFYSWNRLDMIISLPKTKKRGYC